MAPDDRPDMERPTMYRFQVRGRLSTLLTEELEGFTVRAGSTTTLTGPVADAAALYGLIARLESLGLTLLSVEPNRPVPIDAPAPGARPS